MTVRGFFRRLFAGLLSLLMPGLGQTFNRQPKKGILFLVSTPIYVFLLGRFRLFASFAGFMLGVSLPLATLLWAIADATMRGGRQGGEGPGLSANRTWFTVAVLLIVLNGAGSGSDFYRNFMFGGLITRVDRSESMAPTLNEGDRFMADTRCYKDKMPQRGDVILFQSPDQANIDVVKRIVGIGGDVIEGRQDGVYINGKHLREPYILTQSVDDLESNGEINIYGPVKVPTGKFFVLGDNRQDSYDSRYYGAIPESNIKGRALFIYFSHYPHRIGKAIR